MFGINKNLKIHFVGIGGIGMSGIAHILLSLGYKVSGSDLTRGPNVDKLESLGAKIYIGHKKENMANAQILVYSSAIDKTNPEVQIAIEHKIPIIKRAEMLAELMRLKYGIAIAGSHGKTTTTSFVSTIFQKLEQRPTCIIGGIVKNLGSQAVHGDSEFLIAEADESDGSFLFLNPILSVITNIDNDHLDYYQNEENIKTAFAEFSNKVPFYGCVVINANDKNSVSMIENLRRPFFTYAVDTLDTFTDKVDYLARDIKFSEKGSVFRLEFQNESQEVSINLTGNHNVQNALGAIAISHKAGLSLEDICHAISGFSGVGRRFENIYDSKTMVVVDDYAHHPTELKATIETAKSKYPNKSLKIIFEPHRFTRTKEFWNEFINCFENVDSLYLAPIYAASEKPIFNITSERLCQEINKKFSNASLFNNWNFLIDIFNDNKERDVIILTLGAGSISKKTREMMLEWKT